MTRVTALVGAQFGSEGKGLVAEKLAQHYSVHVRTGAPNAGHTYFVDGLKRVLSDGEGLTGMRAAHDAVREVVQGGPVLERVKVVARSVPVGASNRTATLVLGPGAYVDAELLVEEVAELDRLGLKVSGRLYLDSRASLVDKHRHHLWEGGVDGNAHRAIGSTGEGVGPARMARVARGTMPTPSPTWSRIELAQEHEAFFHSHGVQLADTAELLNTLVDEGEQVLLEGTQGSGLSLVHGPWPFSTSCDTNAAQLAVDAGLAPQLVSDVLLVARTYPIRVAGNSGPLPNETSWEELGRPEEHTTVTKKVRRVAAWHTPSVLRACMLNRPDSLALTFVDYWDAAAYGETEWNRLPVDVLRRVRFLSDQLNTGVLLVGTGPDSVCFNTDQALVPGSHRQRWPSYDEVYGD